MAGAKHFTLTLTGSAQRLSSVLTDPTVGGRDDVGYRQIILSQVPANGAVIYVGASSGVSSTSHGFSLDPTQATAVDKVSLGPFDSGPIRLSDLWVIGTNNELLGIFGIPY
jgi:hypothetical protein